MQKNNKKKSKKNKKRKKMITSKVVYSELREQEKAKIKEMLKRKDIRDVEKYYLRCYLKSIEQYG